MAAFIRELADRRLHVLESTPLNPAPGETLVAFERSGNPFMIDRKVEVSDEGIVVSSGSAAAVVAEARMPVFDKRRLRTLIVRPA